MTSCLISSIYVEVRLEGVNDVVEDSGLVVVGALIAKPHSTGTNFFSDNIGSGTAA